MNAQRHMILPLAGTDRLKIGSDRESVRREYAALYRQTVKRGDTDIDDFHCFHAHYEADRLCAVEFFAPCEIYFENTQLIGLDYETCKKLFLRADEDLQIEEGAGFTSVKLQIGVYAPYGTVEAVLVAKSGYYS